MPNSLVPYTTVDALVELKRIMEMVSKFKKPFNMEQWSTPCGTASCAAGYAMFDEWFNERGLVASYGSCPLYKSHYGYSALLNFFRLDYLTVIYIFCPVTYPTFHYNDPQAITPEQVIERIEKVILKQ